MTLWTRQTRGTLLPRRAMTSDLVERLRTLEAWIRNPTGEPYNMNTDLFDDAADEIERLRAALEWAAGKLGAHGFPDLAHQARSRAALGEEKK